MDETVTATSTRSGVRWWLLAAAVAVAALLWWWQAQRAFATLLMTTEPAALDQNTSLRERARTLAIPVYERHCASCHGAVGKRAALPGVPSLSDGHWLYNNDLVDLEQTIYYGIRSGHPRSRNLTDMPALGRIGQITATDAQDAVNYVLSLSQQPHDAASALRGRAIYFAKGNCYDCHASDARGVSDYGTPALTGGSWVYGGDAASLYESIYSGRHGKCPAWYGKLSAVQIRALAVMLRHWSTKA
jgi:cytochrome c oxidase cbb3-type subunit 3